MEELYVSQKKKKRETLFEKKNLFFACWDDSDLNASY